MRLLLIYILVVMTKEGIVCLCEDLYDQKITENVVLCREKFTKKDKQNLY